MEHLCPEQEESPGSSARNTNCSLWPSPLLIGVGFLLTASNLIPPHCHTKLLLLELLLQAAINEAFLRYPVGAFGHSQYLFKLQNVVRSAFISCKILVRNYPLNPSSQAGQPPEHSPEGKRDRSSRKLCGHWETVPEMFIFCHNIPWNEPEQQHCLELGLDLVAAALVAGGAPAWAHPHR